MFLETRGVEKASWVGLVLPSHSVPDGESQQAKWEVMKARVTEASCRRKKGNFLACQRWNKVILACYSVSSEKDSKFLQHWDSRETCTMTWCEVSIKVSSLKHFTFLNIITSVLLGFVRAIIGCKVIHNDAERCVVKSHHLLAKALDLWARHTSVTLAVRRGTTMQRSWFLLSPHCWRKIVGPLQCWGPAAALYSAVPWGTQTDRGSPLEGACKSYKNIF